LLAQFLISKRIEIIMSEFTLPLSDPAATLEVVGGKGASLAKLSRAGLPVPGGFHITTEAYRRFVADNRLQPRILDALREADSAQPASLETASCRIGALFSEAQSPQRRDGRAFAREQVDRLGIGQDLAAVPAGKKKLNLPPSRLLLPEKK
jgi:pyruvate,water dikinase